MLNIIKASNANDKNSTLDESNIAPILKIHDENLEYDLALANDIIKRIKNKNIKLIAFDFDETLLSISTRAKWDDTAEELAQFVRPCFQQLIMELLKYKNLFVCIVTFSEQEKLIRDVLRISLKTTDLKRLVIRGKSGNYDSNGKQLHLKFCREYFEKRNKHLIIMNQEILLIDDDTENVQIAINNGHFAFQVKKNFTLKDLHSYLICENK